MFPIGLLTNNGCPIIFHCGKTMSFLLAFPQQINWILVGVLEMMNKLCLLYIILIQTRHESVSRDNVNPGIH